MQGDSRPEPWACHVTTTGRRTGHPHRIEIWFTILGATVYLISGGSDRSDWVRNLLADPRATVEIEGRSRPATARLPLPAGDERTSAVRRLHAKHAAEVSGTVDDWLARAWIVALDLDREGSQT